MGQREQPMYKHIRRRSFPPRSVLSGVLEELKVLANERQRLGSAIMGALDRTMSHCLHGRWIGWQAREAHSGRFQSHRGLRLLSGRKDHDFVLLGRS